MSQTRIVVGNSCLAQYPQGGGLWAFLLPYLLGLRSLGHDVLWLELFHASPNHVRDHHLIDQFFARFREYGLGDHCAVIRHDVPKSQLTLNRAAVYGKTRGKLNNFLKSADLLLNICGAIRQPLLSLFGRRAFVDLDPGHLQVSALTWDLDLLEHQTFFTVGTKIGEPDCEVPTLGLSWHRFLPVVYMPMWNQEPDPGLSAPFSTITQWGWGELWLGERVLSISKREAYLRYLDLPRRCDRRFELAANIHPDDNTGDRELLQTHGWDQVHPHDVAGSLSAYKQYIARSRAEISCPKPIFRELKTGWVSDRSACYLASGRPVVAEDTGFSDHIPCGNGLLAFKTIEEAVSGVEEIDRNYVHHARAAREIATDLFDSRRSLESMLSACQ